MQTTNTPQFWKKVINANEQNARFVGDDMIEEPALKESDKKDFTMPLLGREKTYTSPRKTYTEITGIEVEYEPVPKIQAFQKRILKVLEDMPEDYIYRTTVTEMINEQAELVDRLSGDLDALEDALGEQVEMYLRSLKRELRCARNLVADQPWGDLFAPAPADQWKWPI
jgi:hypothetical protein